MKCLAQENGKNLVCFKLEERKDNEIIGWIVRRARKVVGA